MTHKKWAKKVMGHHMYYPAARPENRAMLENNPVTALPLPSHVQLSNGFKISRSTIVISDGQKWLPSLP